LILCERGGVMNLGAEGLMTFGAVTGAIAVLSGASPWAGLGVAALAGVLLSIPFALAVVLFRTDQTLSGLAIVALGSGLAAVVGRAYVHKPFAGIPDWDLGAALTGVPIIGPALFRQDPLVYASLILALALAWLLARTRLGLRLRAVGEDPATADAAGVDVLLHRLGAVLAGGLLIGLAGGYLAVVASRVWVDGMVAGRGWIAVALVVFAQWWPIRAIFGALLFGAADALLPRLQATGVDVPPYLMAMLPYLVTILVLVGVGFFGHGRGGQPAALGLPFLRQDRRL
jgi:simple sugar transport system permease protein